MDQSLLVTAGQNLLTYLDREGVEVDAAVWIFAPETRWQLWLAPRNFVDRRSFYLAVAQVLSKHRQQIGDLEISDVRIIEPGDSLIPELKRFLGLVGPGLPMRLTSARLGSRFLPEGIILKAA